MTDIRFPSALEPVKHPVTGLPTEIDIKWPKVSGDLRGRTAVVAM